jgi:hypothetical protein
MGEGGGRGGERVVPLSGFDKAVPPQDRRCECGIKGMKGRELVRCRRCTECLALTCARSNTSCEPCGKEVCFSFKSAHEMRRYTKWN